MLSVQIHTENNGNRSKQAKTPKDSDDDADDAELKLLLVRTPGAAFRTTIMCVSC